MYFGGGGLGGRVPIQILTIYDLFNLRKFKLPNVVTSLKIFLRTAMVFGTYVSGHYFLFV